MTFEKPGHTIYVLMVGEIPTLAFEAASQREAMGLLREAWLHDDLRAGRSNGKPLGREGETLGAARHSRRGDAIYCQRAPVAKALLGKAVLADDSPFTTGGIGNLGTLPSSWIMQTCALKRSAS